MNIEKSTQAYFNIRVLREKNGKDSYDTISLERRDLAQIVAKALKAEGFEVTLTKIVHKKTDRITWKEQKI